MKRRVDEYKRLKEEERLQRAHEEALREQEEAEIRRQQTQDLARFQQRVRERVALVNAEYLCSRDVLVVFFC